MAGHRVGCGSRAAAGGVRCRGPGGAHGIATRPAWTGARHHRWPRPFGETVAERSVFLPDTRRRGDDHAQDGDRTVGLLELLDQDDVFARGPGAYGDVRIVLRPFHL